MGQEYARGKGPIVRFVTVTIRNHSFVTIVRLSVLFSVGHMRISIIVSVTICNKHIYTPIQLYALAIAIFPV